MTLPADMKIKNFQFVYIEFNLSSSYSFAIYFWQESG